LPVGVDIHLDLLKMIGACSLVLLEAVFGKSAYLASRLVESMLGVGVGTAPKLSRDIQN